MKSRLAEDKDKALVIDALLYSISEKNKQRHEDKTLTGMGKRNLLESEILPMCEIIVNIKNGT